MQALKSATLTGKNMTLSPSDLSNLPVLVPATVLLVPLLLPLLAAVWWQSRRAFDRRLKLLRRQVDAQRAATSEFLEHAHSQIGLLQSELAKARRREDVLRARQAIKSHRASPWRTESGRASAAMLIVRCAGSSHTTSRRSTVQAHVAADVQT